MSCILFVVPAYHCIILYELLKAARLCCRGIGMSTDTYTGNYTLDDYATSTVGLIAALRLGNPDVLGVSLGSLIAQTIAVNYGTDASHIVLSNTALTGIGLLDVPDPASASNVFVAAGAMSTAIPGTRTYPINLPAGLAGFCRNQNLTSYNPNNTATSAQLAQQATIEYDFAGPGGDEVSTSYCIEGLHMCLHHALPASNLSSIIKMLQRCD